MESEEFHRQRNDRTLRYGERNLDPERPIIITGCPAYLSRLEGQVAVITLANLLGRMSPNVAVGFPDVALHPALPWKGPSLKGFVVEQMRQADIFGTFEDRDRRDGDYVVHVGAEGHSWVVHGSGWNSYVGPSPSPLVDASEGNPFGAAFASITAASRIFKPQFPEVIDEAVLADVLRWRAEAGEDLPFKRGENLGSLWFIGVGSVGSAVAYFLALAGLKFEPKLIDMDVVKIHNLDRSPVFLCDDIGKPKVEAVGRFLASVGIDATAEPGKLRESQAWQTRQAGTPDILISAANEDNVRYDIENGYPPIQVFGTTGKNWQSAVMTFVPLSGVCTCCLFPPEKPADTECATAPSEGADSEEQVDAALPFLSFAAGLMTAIELAKIGMEGWPFAEDRALFQPLSDEVVVGAQMTHRGGCICENLHASVHKAMVSGSKFDGLGAS